MDNPTPTLATWHHNTRARSAATAAAAAAVATAVARPGGEAVTVAVAAVAMATASPTALPVLELASIAPPIIVEPTTTVVEPAPCAVQLLVGRGDPPLPMVPPHIPIMATKPLPTIVVHSVLPSLTEES